MKLTALKLYLLVFIFAMHPLSILAEQSYTPLKPIKIAINKSSFPYHFENEQGQPAGIMVDLWSLWAEKQAVEVEFVLLNDWGDTLAQVANGSIDLHAGLSINDERQKIFDYTKPLFFHDSHVFIHRGIEEIGRAHV